MSSPSFDPKAAFFALDDDARNGLGIAGLAVAYAIASRKWYGDRAPEAFAMAESHACEILAEAARGALAPDTEAGRILAIGHLAPGATPAAPLIDLQRLGIDQCRICGRTENLPGTDPAPWALLRYCAACGQGARDAG